MNCTVTPPVRVLIVPGLHDSGPAHWQTWLQRHHRGARRVIQADVHTPELDRWADRIGETLAKEPAGDWVAVAHSFGCLALVRALALRLPGTPAIAAALLVAPADPLKFGVADLLPRTPLAVTSVLAASRTDPWMPLASSAAWAAAWGSQWLDLGDAGHVNTDSGHGPWPLGQQLVARQLQRLARQRRVDNDDVPEQRAA